MHPLRRKIVQGQVLPLPSRGSARTAVLALPMSRRAALAGMVTAPLAVQIPAERAAAESAVAERIRVAAEKNAAFMRGWNAGWRTGDCD